MGGNLYCDEAHFINPVVEDEPESGDRVERGGCEHRRGGVVLQGVCEGRIQLLPCRGRGASLLRWSGFRESRQVAGSCGGGTGFGDG